MADEFFQISTVSRLSGVSLHTIRAWEKRYAVVVPQRTDTQRRLYTRDDIQRLTLLKELVDNGHTISSLAKFDSSKLEKLLAEQREANPQSSSCRVVVVGEALNRILKSEKPHLGQLEVVSSFRNLETAKTAEPGTVADFLMVETPTLFVDTLTEIDDLRESFSVQRVVVIYRFAQNEALRAFGAQSWVSLIQGPVNAQELLLSCVPHANANDRSVKEFSKEPAPEVRSVSDIPPRRYSDDQLAEVARTSVNLQCECPQHLSNLLQSLNAFETYSAECENRNEADAELHAYLHRSTAASRTAIEEALSRVLEAENIQI